MIGSTRPWLTCGALALLALPLGAQQPRGKAIVRPGEINTPPARGERQRDTLRVGDLAPDFTLPDQAGKKEVTLSSFRGKRPVVLVFGSYT